MIKKLLGIEEVDLGPIHNKFNETDRWISHLHNYSKKLHSYSDEIKHSNITHKKEIVAHLKKINTWIDYLHTSHLDMKKEMSQLGESLRFSLKKDFESYHNILSEYLELKFAEHNKHMEKVQNRILEKVDSKISAPLDYPEYVPEFEVKEQSVDLTNPEKELLSLLFNENQPLTYQALAKKLGKSVSSVRVYMNSLKSKKDVIEEFLTPQGAKVFAIKNSEIVSKLFNY